MTGSFADGKILAIDEYGRFLAPSGYAQIERESHQFFRMEGQLNLFLERITGLFSYGYYRIVTGCCGHFIVSIESGCKAIVRSGQPEMFRKIGPALSLVMLAAAVAMR